MIQNNLHPRRLFFSKRPDFFSFLVRVRRLLEVVMVLVLLLLPLVILSRRSIISFRYRSGICFRMLSVLCFRHLAFATMLFPVRYCWRPLLLCCLYWMVLIGCVSRCLLLFHCSQISPDWLLSANCILVIVSLNFFFQTIPRNGVILFFQLSKFPFVVYCFRIQNLPEFFPRIFTLFLFTS